MICKYFLPICGLSFPFLDDAPSRLPTSSPTPYLGPILSFFFPLTFIYLFSCTRSSRGIFSLHCSMPALWLWHIGSSSRVWIEPRPPKLGVCIPSHWTTKEVLGLLLFWSYSSFFTSSPGATGTASSLLCGQCSRKVLTQSAIPAVPRLWLPWV